MGRFALITALARLALRDTQRRIGQTVVLAVLAALFLAIALVCLTVAAGIWLAQLTSPLIAALSRAGGAALLGLICLWLSGRARRARRANLRDLRQEAAQIAANLKGQAADLPPTISLGGAALVGLILGLKLLDRK